MKFRAVTTFAFTLILLASLPAFGQENAEINTVDSCIFGNLIARDTVTGNGNVTFFFFGHQLAVRSKTDSSDRIHVFDPRTLDSIFQADLKHRGPMYRQDFSLPYLRLYESLADEGPFRVEIFDSTGRIVFTVEGNQGGMTPTKSGKFFYMYQGDPYNCWFRGIYDRTGNLHPIEKTPDCVGGATMIGDTALILIEGPDYFYDRISVYRDTTFERYLTFNPPLGINSPYILASPTAKYVLLSGPDGPVIVMDSGLTEIYRNSKKGIMDINFSEDGSCLAFLKRGEYRAGGEYDLFVELYSVSDFSTPIWTDQLEKSLFLYTGSESTISEMAFRGPFVRLLISSSYFTRFGKPIPRPKTVMYRIEPGGGKLLRSCIFSEVVDILAFGDTTITASTFAGKPDQVILSRWQL